MLGQDRINEEFLNKLQFDNKKVNELVIDD